MKNVKMIIIGLIIFMMIFLIGAWSSTAREKDPDKGKNANNADCGKLYGREKETCEAKADQPERMEKRRPGEGQKCHQLFGREREVCEATRTHGPNAGKKSEPAENMDCRNLYGRSREICESKKK